MKTIFTFLSLTAFTFLGNSQIVANPGTNNWTSASAWMGGVVPTITDAVVIGPNATVVVNISLIHNGDITINGGVLSSLMPSNDLTMNNANLTLIGFGSQLSFLSSSAVPVTLNDVVVTNGGVFMCGDLYITYTGVLADSQNNGDFMVSGDMELDGVVIFTNNLGLNVNSELLINSNARMNNNQSESIGSIYNEGIFDNLASVGVTDSLYNESGANYWSNNGNTSIGANTNNSGNISLNDNFNITGSLNNTGTFTNDGGAVAISTNFYNSGTITGSSNGSYVIALNSENASGGIISDTIDVCDASLVPGTYLDIDNNLPGIDFGSVTFCTVSLASIENNELQNIVISPNPTSNNVQISGELSGTCILFNSDGRILIEKQLGKNTTLDLSTLPNGVYHLGIYSDKGTSMKKIIKF